VQALVFERELKFTRDYPLPRPGDGEALVQVTLAGICNTDLEITRGYMDFHGILGHEFVGIVRAASDTALLGRRVVGEINAACGTCPRCLAGMPTHCANRTVLGISGRDGSFADYLALPQANLHVVPDSIPDEQAVFVEPLAAALEVLDQVHVRPTDRVIVLGDGKLGLLVARVLRLTGCDLTVIGKHPAKLARLDALGVTAITTERTGSRTADVVVDCTGNPSGFEMARSLVRPRGTIVLKSTFHGAPPLALTPVVVDEITIVGSRCGPFAAALRILERGLVVVADLVSGVYPLSDGLAAFARAVEPDTIKILLQPDRGDMT